MKSLSISTIHCTIVQFAHPKTETGKRNFASFALFATPSIRLSLHKLYLHNTFRSVIPGVFLLKVSVSNRTLGYSIYFTKKYNNLVLEKWCWKGTHICLVYKGKFCLFYRNVCVFIRYKNRLSENKVNFTIIFVSIYIKYKKFYNNNISVNNDACIALT